MKTFSVVMVILMFSLTACGGTKSSLSEHTNASNGHHHDGKKFKQHRGYHTSE